MRLSRQQTRAVDRLAIERYGFSGLVLMENAGRGVADVLCAQKPRGTVVICCGRGNNGGDGLVIARQLDLRQIAVRVLLLTDAELLRGDASANYRILQHCATPIDILPSLDKPEALATLQTALAGADWIVDALLGTGATGEPRSPLDLAIDQINAAGKPVLAVDLPSGLDCDTGHAASHTIRAKLTCTFVARKIGFDSAGAAQYTGQVQVLDIGVPQKLIAEARQLGQ